MNRRNRHFFKEEMQMANRRMKRWATLLIIRETKIKTAVRYHPTPARMPSTKRTQITSVCEDLVKREASCTVCVSANGTAPVENSMEASQKTKNQPIL